jgi:hypothetical protein
MAQKNPKKTGRTVLEKRREKKAKQDVKAKARKHERVQVA